MALLSFFPKRRARRVSGANSKVPRLDIPRYIEDAKNWLLDAREKLRDIPGTNYALGIVHIYKEEAEDALIRFRLYTWFRPADPEGWYYLGRSYALMRNPKQATRFYSKALAMSPSLLCAQYALAKLAAPELLPRVPVEVLAEKGKALAMPDASPRFSTEFKLPIQLAEMVVRALPRSTHPENIVELSCHEGIVAQHLRAKGVGRYYTGVDISEAQLEKAKKLNFADMHVFDRLEHMEDTLFLAKTSSHDLIVTIDSVTVWADVSPFFAALSKHMSAGSVIGFLHILPSVKDPKSKNSDITWKESKIIKNVEFCPELDCFAHPAESIDRALSAHAFSLLEVREAEGLEGLPCRLVVAIRN